MLDAVTLHSLREQIRETARYVASHPDLVRCNLDGIIEQLYNLGRNGNPHEDILDRLLYNLEVGADNLLVDPEVARSYCYGAVFELGCIRSTLINQTRDER